MVLNLHWPASGLDLAEENQLQASQAREEMAPLILKVTFTAGHATAQVRKVPCIRMLAIQDRGEKQFCILQGVAWVVYSLVDCEELPQPLVYVCSDSITIRWQHT